jgi:hypothetical protein
MRELAVVLLLGLGFFIGYGFVCLVIASAELWEMRKR